LNDLDLQINQALDRLPEKCGEVFRLSRQQDLSYKEIAEHLDISIKTVENQMGKALRIMRVELQSYLTECLLIFLFLQSW
jgi:RNA polymerase sigma-70 factor (ECF subfamily)